MDVSRTLQVTTPSPNEVVLRRAFDAPRRLVFRALTTPALLERWYGPPGWTLPFCELDLRVGGVYRFVSRGPDGYEFEMRGRYLEVEPPERLVYTERFAELPSAGDTGPIEGPARTGEQARTNGRERADGRESTEGRERDEALVTTVLTETDGVTTMTTTVRYASPQHRDRVLAAGMARGAAASFDRLAAYLSTAA